MSFLLFAKCNNCAISHFVFGAASTSLDKQNHLSRENGKETELFPHFTKQEKAVFRLI